MKTPFLSTSFSESGKKVKKRFNNILGESKKVGCIALLCITLIIGIMGTLVACESDSNNSEINNLFKSKTRYVGNNSAVAKIISLCPPIDNVVLEDIKLETESEPYGIIINCKSSSENLNASQFKNNAIIILSLVENAEFVEFSLGDNKYKHNREDLDKLFDKPLLTYSSDLDSFKELFSKLSSDNFKPETLKQAVSKAIISNNNSNFLYGECVSEGHIILKSEEKDDKIIAYTLTTYGNYGFENGIFTKISGTGIIPCRIIFNQNLNLEAYTNPMDGADYVSSIETMFPKELHERALNPTKEDELSVTNQENAYALAYLKSISRDAKISKDHVEKTLPNMNVEASNKLSNMYSEYPYWVGTLENIENSSRFIYEKKWEDKGNGNGTVSYIKYKSNKDLTEKTIVEESVIEIINGELKYLKGTARNENH